MTKEIIIDGHQIHDIKSFYEEINLKFMQGEDWQLGESLDAFNDLLYGGFGAVKGDEPINLIWKNFENNKKILGSDFTLEFYRQKLKHPDIYDVEAINKSINELESGDGQSYFDIVLEIIADHSNLILIPD